jgi:hypothetical protein
MIIKKSIMILLPLVLIFQGNAQTLRNNKLTNQVDSIFIFPAVGVIKCYQGKKILPNDSLTNVFQDKLELILPHVSEYKVVCLGDEYELSDSLKEYFVNTIKKFSSIDKDIFSVIPLGTSFTKMVSDVPGRYFGIIFYDGFLNAHIKEQVAGSIAMGVATAVLTGGMFAIYTVPQEHVLINDFLLIDKEANRFLYYKRRKQGGPPTSDEAIEKNYKKIFEGFE